MSEKSESKIKPKMAILLRGLSDRKSYQRRQITADIDYRLLLNNNRQNLYNELSKDVDLHFFLVTYENTEEFKKELNDNFKPSGVYYFDKEFEKTYDTQAFSKSHKRNQLMIQKGLNMISEYESNNNIEFEYMFLTRFDLFWLNKMPLNWFDLTKINVTWTGLTGQNDDNGIFVPSVYKTKIGNIIDNCLKTNTDTHRLGTKLKKDEWMAHHIGVKKNGKEQTQKIYTQSRNVTQEMYDEYK